ncbi:MAG: thiolase family protein [Actinobacteria bacterium]|nr:thiolase family protein [Actinomycetota bacterium]MCG2796759.1 thiolase family protein [Actinomycetes bacterium]MBU4240944.1 thiolase family protein [Actinomycetota bacterium]MBU4302316.1 thiolase family protein [Actinomycetota bacterium]MBU4385785.1 thiolase family protein [Actinomycetota bacterium]
MKAGVIGVSALPVGRHQGENADLLLSRLLRDALGDAGVDKSEVQALFTTPEGFTVRCTKIRAARLACYMGMELRTATVVENGGASSALGVKSLVREIESGRVDVGVVFSSEVEKYDFSAPEDLPAIMDINALYLPHDCLYGLMTATAYYALSMQRYMWEYSVPHEDISRVAVLLRDNASRNPLAQYRDPITLEDILASRVISPPIRLLDCSPASDGGAAVIIASEEYIKRKRKDAVYITGIGEWHDSSHFIPPAKGITHFPAITNATAEALEAAGRKIEDVDVAEVYGVFTSSELITYEDMGFFSKGKAPEAVARGETAIDGSIPINPSGGRLSLGHPFYVTPLLEIAEIYWQLTGNAGDRQVKDPRVGLVEAEHGMMNGSIVLILEV